MCCFSPQVIRWLLRKTYPWSNLVLRMGAIALSPPVHRTRHQLRFWRMVYQIDFAGLIAGVIELSQPEFWV